jgi:hypothetical protein
MSVHIVVQRDNPLPAEAQDIVEPLLGDSVPAATERGRTFLCEEGTGEQPIVYTTLFRPGVRLGQLVEITDSILGINFRGKVISISHKVTRGGQFDPFKILTTLTIRKSSEFTVIPA